MALLRHGTSVGPSTARSTPPLVVCLLGPFRLLKSGQPLGVRGGGKTEAFLSNLALHQGTGVPREQILEMLWPKSEAALAAQSLNSLVHSLHKLVGDALDGAAPVVHVDGRYRLNLEAGVGVDVASFDALADAGERLARAGDRAAAADARRRALSLYRGDLCTSADVHAVIERERLRARFLALLAHLADDAYESGDHATCLAYALRLLRHDPCREDAHRLVMRCHVRRGERAQALRQFRLCAAILLNEFDAKPEPATLALFDRIRLAPETI